MEYTVACQRSWLGGILIKRHVSFQFKNDTDMKSRKEDVNESDIV